MEILLDIEGSEVEVVTDDRQRPRFLKIRPRFRTPSSLATFAKISVSGAMPDGAQVQTDAADIEVSGATGRLRLYRPADNVIPAVLSGKPVESDDGEAKV